MQFLNITFTVVHSTCNGYSFRKQWQYSSCGVVTSILMHFFQDDSHLLTVDCLLYSPYKETIRSTLQHDHITPNEISVMYMSRLYTHTAEYWLPLQKLHLNVQPTVSHHEQYLLAVECSQLLWINFFHNSEEFLVEQQTLLHEVECPLRMEGKTMSSHTMMFLKFSEFINANLFLIVFV